MSKKPPTLLEICLKRGTKMREIRIIATDLKAYAHNIESEEMVNQILELCKSI